MFDSNNEGLIMNPDTRDLIAQLIQYILDNEESHYEMVLDTFGPDSEQVRSHAYTLAWDIATELEITL
jgi:hypothetical protein